MKGEKILCRLGYARELCGTPDEVDEHGDYTCPACREVMATWDRADQWLEAEVRALARRMSPLGALPGAGGDEDILEKIDAIVRCIQCGHSWCDSGRL